MRLVPLCVLALFGCGQEISGTTEEHQAGADAARGDAPGSVVPDAAASRPDAGAPDAAPPPPTPDAGTTTTVTLKRCTGRAFSGSPAGDFRHVGSALIALASPEHAGLDVVAVGSGAVTASAKFEYGPFFKDLEDEDVRVYVDDCSGWKLQGSERTDGDGRISHVFPALAYGVYDVRYEVVGDATTAPAQLWILPRGTRLAVFDIDGTLTTSDLEVVKDFFDEIVSGDYVPEAYPGAVELTHAVRDVGYVGVYMTGRPYWLTRATKKWLAEMGFAPGPLFLAPSTADALPTNGGVGDYKLGNLRAFDGAGLRLDWAHGNATTDIYAYLGAGIPAADTWIIGPHAGESGTVGVEDSWQDRVLQIQALPPVSQPFVW